MSDSEPSPVLSVAIAVYNEAPNLPELIPRLRYILEGTALSWEIVLVNDGSTDNTWEVLRELQQADDRLRILDLSRNFGKELALTAALDHTRGQAVIPMDGDLQDPPEVIPALIEKWQEGYEVVNAARTRRRGETWLKRLTSAAFYRLLNLSGGTRLPPDVGDFRLLSRPVVEVLLRMRERRRFMKGLFAWSGFRQTTVYYERERRHRGQSKWNYRKLWRLAVEGFTSFTDAPLRLASYFGFAVSLLSFLYGSFLIINTLFFGNPVPGYPSLMVVVLFLGGIQLLAIGLIGEYIGRIYEESKRRPLYVVREAVGFGSVPSAAELQMVGPARKEPKHGLS